MRFFDTNILAYCFDHSAPAKQVIARKLLGNALQEGDGVISSQVVQEFVNVALRKFKVRMTTGELQVYSDRVLTPLCKHFPSMEFYQRALVNQDREQLGWYDSLILTAAQDAGARELVSEDFQTSRRYGAVVVVNPFASVA